MEDELTIEFVREYLISAEFDLSPSQDKLSFPKLKRFFNELRNQTSFRAILVENDVIIDGHHRYICLHILKSNIAKLNWSGSPTLEIKKWKDVFVDLNDWG